MSDRATARRMNARSVRNPVVDLLGANDVAGLPPEAKRALRKLLLSVRADARARAEKSWRQHKAPMAAYWKAVSVYAGHIARVVGGPTSPRSAPGGGT